MTGGLTHPAGPHRGAYGSVQDVVAAGEWASGTRF